MSNDIDNTKAIEPEIIDGKMAAGLIGTTYWSLLDFCKRGLVPHFRVGKKVLFRRSTLTEWIASQEARCQRWR